jgi:hypothetical protein
MTQLETLKEEIKKLSAAEFGKLRDWLLEQDWMQWDQQIEQDSASGKLDALFEEAERAHLAGKSTKFESLRGTFVLGRASTHCRPTFKISHGRMTACSS